MNCSQLCALCPENQKSKINFSRVHGVCSSCKISTSSILKCRYCGSIIPALFLDEIHTEECLKTESKLSNDPIHAGILNKVELIVVKDLRKAKPCTNTKEIRPLINSNAELLNTEIKINSSTVLNEAIESNDILDTLKSMNELQAICSRDPPEFQEICSRDPPEIQEICSRDPSEFQEICSRDPLEIQEICSRDPPEIQEICSRDPPEIQLEYPHKPKSRVLIIICILSTIIVLYLLNRYFSSTVSSEPSKGAL